MFIQLIRGNRRMYNTERHTVDLYSCQQHVVVVVGQNTRILSLFLGKTQDILLTRNTLLTFAHATMLDLSWIVSFFYRSLSPINQKSLGVTFIQNRETVATEEKVFSQDFLNWWNSFQQQNPTFWTFQTPPGWSLRWSRGWSARRWLCRWPRWQSRWWPRWPPRWWPPLSARRVRLYPQSDLAKGRSQYLSFLCPSCGTLKKLGIDIGWIFEDYL